MRISLKFLLLFLPSFISVEVKSQYIICDTLYLLTNGNVKYWDDTNNSKRCISFSYTKNKYQQFSKGSSTGELNSDTIEERRRVYYEYEYHDNYKPHIRRYYNPSSSHLAGDDYEIKDGKLFFYERRSEILITKCQIIKLTSDSLIIEQGGRETVYIQSCDQEEKGERLPHLQIGYEWPL